MFLRTALSAAILAASLVPALAADVEFGDLTIADPYILETPPGAKSAGAYMVITNSGETDARVTDAKADFAMAQLHLSTMGDDGVMRMEHQAEGVPLPAGESVEFAPGGLHVMLMGLSEPAAAGETRDITLIFEDAGEATVTFEVRPR